MRAPDTGAWATPVPSPVVLPPLEWVASPNFSERSNGQKVRLIVVHDTEGGYSGAVSWFSQAKSEVSAHIVLREDGLEATQMVPYSKKAWHCAAFNSSSIGLEMAGIASHGYGSEELRRAARIVAFLCHEFGLPPTLLASAKDVLNKPGFSFHQYLGAAGGGHHDPGFSWVKAKWFERLVKQEYKRGGFRKDYGR